MKQLLYTDFAKTCLHDLMKLQDDFNNKYDPNGYDNWFYNQATGLLTFSTGNQEINFKYAEVGTFSKKSNTWKWSWDNEHTLTSVKADIDAVRSFGQQSGFDKLTHGYFNSSEAEAWEFTAIAAKIINGIGVYRPVSERVLIFMVLQEFVDTATAKDIKEKYVQCSAHEYRRRAFVCKHLNKYAKVGFEESFETFEEMELGEDDDFQAWCSKCERVRKKEDGWNDVSMAYADIKVICEECYFEMKEVNLGYR